jgi:hypothetical protein
MKPLRLFHVIVIGCTKKHNGPSVMAETMQLWKVEVLPDSEFNENVLIFMKSAQGILQSIETFRAVYRVLRQVEEIKKRPYSTNQARCRPILRKGEIHHESKNDATYVFMFLTRKI